MLTNLIPVFAVFAVVYLIIAIVLQRQRERLAREGEAEREARRKQERLEELAERQRERYLRQSDRPRWSPSTVHSDPFAREAREGATLQDTAWLNTWLTDDSRTE